MEHLLLLFIDYISITNKLFEEQKTVFCWRRSTIDWSITSKMNMRLTNHQQDEHETDQSPARWIWDWPITSKMNCATRATWELTPEKKLSLFHKRKEGNDSFNNTPNTFYLQLYGTGHIVDDHSEKDKNQLQPFFPISNNESSICITPQTG